MAACRRWRCRWRRLRRSAVAGSFRMQIRLLDDERCNRNRLPYDQHSVWLLPDQHWLLHIIKSIEHFVTSTANDLYIWDSTGSSTGGSAGNGFNAYNLTSRMPANSHIVSIGGGYEGQNMGMQLYTLSSDGTYDDEQGIILSRSFDANGSQTSVQGTSLWSFNQVRSYIASAGYVIAGNIRGTSFNNTGVYNIDPSNMTINTGG